MNDDLPYRACAGIMLLNTEGKVFVGQRIDSATDAWQMPQGGIDDGEDGEAAAYRELYEETGIAPHLVRVVVQSPREHFYDLPPHLIGKLWQGKYRGQRQSWFLMRFHGCDADINIATTFPEFRAWKWVDVADVEASVVSFKRDLYRDIIAEFSQHF